MKMSSCWWSIVSSIALSGSVFSEEDPLLTRSYSFPPNFLQIANGYLGTGDVFSSFGAETSPLTVGRWLKEQGVRFGEGASAVFRKETSTLVVRNTAEQLYTIEQLLVYLREENSKFIRVTISEIDLDPDILRKAEEMEIPWLLPLPEEKAWKMEDGDAASSPYLTFLQELSRPPHSVEEDLLVPEGRGVAAVFTNEQMIKELDALDEGIRSLQSLSHRLVVHSGQPGLVKKADRRYGVVAEASDNLQHVRLAVFLPEHGKALFHPGESLQTPYNVTFFDGDTVVLSAPREDGGNRVVMVRAELIDAGGNLLNPDGVER